MCRGGQKEYRKAIKEITNRRNKEINELEKKSNSEWMSRYLSLLWSKINWPYHLYLFIKRNHYNINKNHYIINTHCLEGDAKKFMLWSFDQILESRLGQELFNSFSYFHSLYHSTGKIFKINFFFKTSLNTSTISDLHSIQSTIILTHFKCMSRR